MTEDRDETAALYAAGALTPSEAAAFELWLDSGDEASIRAWLQVAPVAEALLDAPPVQPSLAARSSILRKARRPVAPFFVQRGEEAEWKRTSMPGVERRLLFSDADRGVETFMLRVAPGGVVPRHVHRGPEECYVLEGSLVTGDVAMNAGDYIRFPGGTRHEESRTDDGCLLLFTAPMHEHDE